jgi:hypothetical protein
MTHPEVLHPVSYTKAVVQHPAPAFEAVACQADGSFKKVSLSQYKGNLNNRQISQFLKENGSFFYSTQKTLLLSAQLKFWHLMTNCLNSKL